MQLDIDPLAEAEAREAATWYERQREALGWQFYQNFLERLDRIGRNPKSFPLIEVRVRGEFRYCLLNPFPYRICFEVNSNQVTVIAVAHVRRGPAYWNARLRDYDR